mgnify:FL=1
MVYKLGCCFFCNLFTLTHISMAKIYTMPEIGIIIDGIYRNYSKAKIDQKNVNKLAADCNTSANVLMKVRNILAEMRQIIIEGERAQQKCYWNTSKCAPNPALLTEVYRTYTKDVKSRVKVEKKVQRLPSFELALLALKKQGWDMVILKKSSGYKKVSEEYNLIEIEE